MAEYGYTREFRIKLLALMLDNSWMLKFGDSIIQPEYFDRADEESIAKGIIEYRRKYKQSPSDDVDLYALVGKKDDENSGKLVETVFDTFEQVDLRLAADTALQFAKEQAARLAILESVDDIQRGDLQKPIERMKEALAVGDNLIALGLDPVADVSDWLYDYWSDKVPTGWHHVDMILEGGVGPGELGCILAPQNRGKSMTLVNLGYACASIACGGNVIHFSHEMYAAQVAKRYAARMVFRFPRKNDNLDEYAEELVDKARKLLPGRIRIIDGPMNINQYDAKVNRLIDEGFNPRLIIDDYGDLIFPDRKYNERRFEISAIFSHMRDSGGIWGVPTWTASQSRREGHSKEIITMQDMAEDIGKVSISDVIISVNQTYEELITDQCRLFMAKVRDGVKGAVVAAKFLGKSQAIITTGLVDRKDEADV